MGAVESWAWWLIVAVLLCAPVVHTALLEFVMFGIGAGAASLAAGLGVGVVWQFVVFLVTTLSLLLLVRPVTRRQRRQSATVRHGIEALKGAEAVVLERVDEHDGRIKLKGEVWSARALGVGQSFEPGERVSVAEIDGATAIVL
ncbi:NfeD family protein [Streptacidiphilus pinicola]|uniref:NfeD family protein n=1 Tax=Streptacidiphilus pinicola TaxID=2219663 RepID=A0A2X0IAC1_9ACTN|nr:NfeD family protein [Streptacidiphilus pinicola]RAG81894.1 NfeD family protein [Streptacidiphilus pinicola]